MSERRIATLPLEHEQAHELVRNLGRPLCGGNRIELLRDTPALIDALARAIAGATDHINLCGDLVPMQAGAELADRLVQRLRAGVKVNLCCEGFGALGFDAPSIERLAQAGVSLCGAGPSASGWAASGWAAWLHLMRQPRMPPGPLLVADGRRALVGVGGAAALGLAVDGPVVRHLQRLFLRQWRLRSREPVQPARYFPPLAVTGTQRVGVIDGDDRSTHTRALLGAMGQARSDVGLGTRAALPPADVRHALVAAVRRGVRVTLLRHGSAQHLDATRAAWAPLVHAGLRVHEQARDDAASELCVIDRLWVGIAACDPAAGLVVLDRRLARGVEQGFRDELGDAVAVLPAKAVSTPAWQRLRTRLARR